MQSVPKRIRVLIVDDSVFFRTIVINLLVRSARIQVAGTAADPYEAREKLAELNPDVMTLDINMPRMNGIDFLKEQLPRKWIPTIVISTRNDIVFEAMSAGAVDFVEKPDMTPRQNLDAFADDIADKIIVAASAAPGHHDRRMAAVARSMKPQAGAASPGLIALGASTGGTEATSYILQQLPGSIPGMVIVQHMPPVFTKMYAQRLDRETKLAVKEAEERDVVKPGHVYVAAGDEHIQVVREGAEMYLHRSHGVKVNGHRPSVDVMFDSVAEFADRSTTAIILTGMGADGASGIVKLRKKGAYTIGQDEASSIVYGMPMVAYQMGGIVKQAPLEGISQVLLDHLFGGK
jgi:two-component system chemotaxis response regulator CheB